MSEIDAPDGLPRIRVRESDDEVLVALRGLQELVLQHPIAMQAAFGALMREGRRFAATEEGRAWSRRLERSALLHHARLVWKMATLSALEEQAPDALPTAYLDGVFLAAASGDPDGVLDRLFGAGEPER